MQNKIWKKTLSVVLTCGMLFPMSSFIQEPMVVDAKTNVELSKTTLRMMTGETTRLQVLAEQQNIMSLLMKPLLPYQKMEQ